MQIRSLTVTQFRNLDSLTLEPVDTINIFHGPNGSGKTNLLEALFTVSLGRSQKGAADSVLVRNNKDFYRIEGQIAVTDRVKQVTVAYQRGSRRKITLDGVAARTAELFENFCVVSLGPEDSDILSGPPSARRLFINLYLSQMSVAYLDDLTRYRQVLLQKNAALRRGLDPEPFNDLLVSYGCRVMRVRNRMIGTLARKAATLYLEISDGEALDVTYRPSVAMADLTIEAARDNGLSEIFHRQIAAAAQREQALGASVVGPHRDELEITINGYPARSFGSQGQWRTAAVALKLAVYDLLKTQRGEPPMLLLDEIFAELDPLRTLKLVGTLGQFSQIFLTTAQEPPEPLRQAARCFDIVNGTVTGVS